MQLARVIGNVVSTIKDSNLHGHTMLMVQPIAPDRTPFGRALVALDAVGAGVGEFVFFVRGREATFPFLPGEPPADACVVGIVDSWDVPALNTRAPAAETGAPAAETGAPAAAAGAPAAATGAPGL